MSLPVSQGIIYLIQPFEYLEKHIYKIGCSKNLDLTRVKYGYKPGTKPLSIAYCHNQFELEKIIKFTFNNDNNIKLFKGYEYFECNDENYIIKLFNDIVYNYKINDILTSKDFQSYENSSSQLIKKLLNETPNSIICSVNGIIGPETINYINNDLLEITKQKNQYVLYIIYLEFKKFINFEHIGYQIYNILNQFRIYIDKKY